MKLRSLKRHIPTTFTMMNLMTGFAAIIIADLRISSFLLLLGMFFDVLDGLLARLLKASSEIGKELDSLADLVSFGVAPAFLYSLMRPGDHWSFYLPSFILLIGSAYRLAIFNIKPGSNFFKGLATPASTMLLVGIFLSYPIDTSIYTKIIDINVVYVVIPMILSFLMLSDLTMFSLKNIGESKGLTYFVFGGILVFILLLLINYRMALVVSVLIYIALSLFYTLFLRNNPQEGLVKDAKYLN